MGGLDLVFSSHASSQNFMVARSGFFLRLGRVVSKMPSIGRRRGLKSVLGTFAFYIKGRRASPPAGEMTLQAEAQRVAIRPRTPLKSKINPSNLPSQPTRHDQSKEDSPKYEVLLVEDNLVNRRYSPPLPNAFD